MLLISELVKRIVPQIIGSYLFAGSSNISFRDDASYYMEVIGA